MLIELTEDNSYGDREILEPIFINTDDIKEISIYDEGITYFWRTNSIITFKNGIWKCFKETPEEILRKSKNNE